ncbi:MAG: hypothetical protein HYV61_13245, partial [Candidatus Rokubacteria bacterium]|nr:hypothetical protein [Candidatus Rokubacteria bacterium]
KVRDGEDRTRKWVHRELALRRGVPGFIARGEQVRAQDGSAVPAILQALAEKHFNGRRVSAPAVIDYGSNYRYLGNDYGTPEMAAFLADVTRTHKIHILPVAVEERRPS